MPSRDQEEKPVMYFKGTDKGLVRDAFQEKLAAAFKPSEAAAFNNGAIAAFDIVLNMIAVADA